MTNIYSINLSNNDKIIVEKDKEFIDRLIENSRKCTYLEIVDINNKTHVLKSDSLIHIVEVF